MGCEVIQDRKIKLAEGQKLLKAYKVSGFPFGDSAPDVMMDFVRDGANKLVRFSKCDVTGRTNGKTWEWDTAALRQLDNGLAMFAKSMGIDHQTPQAFLARFIEDKVKQV